VFVAKIELMGGESAANYAIACARWWLKTGFIGKLGKDAFGECLMQDFREEKMETERVFLTMKLLCGGW
jgi:sugar/nucleoside kinase (ribokinase family)